MGLAPDKEVARKAGVAPITVKRRRKREGIPGISPYSYDWPIEWLQDFQLRWAFYDVLGGVALDRPLTPREINFVPLSVIRQRFAEEGITHLRRRGKFWRRARKCGG
jgi:hypothetical protein